jgi:hypothetical protein
MLFMADILMRANAYRKEFLCGRGKDVGWNVFDAVCVFGYLLEVALLLVATETMESGGIWEHSGVLRTVRLVRLVRFFNVLRMVAVFRDLRVMVTSMIDAVVPLLWFMVTLLLVLACFGIVFTDAISDYREHMYNLHKKEPSSYPEKDVDSLTISYYGGLGVTMSTLFKAVTGGLDWENCLSPLRDHTSWIYVVFFYAFISFTMFAMVNVGNALFIDMVLQRSKLDREFVIEQTNQEKQTFMVLMDALFADIDRDKSGRICLEELRWHLANQPQVDHLLRALDINVQEVTHLFALMDIDESGFIDRDEFREGCEKLRRDARQLDLAIMHREIRKSNAQLMAIAKAMGVDMSDMSSANASLASGLPTKGKNRLGAHSDPY